jgi:hypothetical protein
MNRTHVIAAIITSSLLALPLLTPAAANPQSSSGGQPLACPTFTQNLSVGSTGGAVAQLQAFLISHHLFAPGSITT